MKQDKINKKLFFKNTIILFVVPEFCIGILFNFFSGDDKFQTSGCNFFEPPLLLINHLFTNLRSGQCKNRPLKMTKNGFLHFVFLR